MPRVLLVEDDPDQLEIRRLLLEAAGYQVETAQTPVAAREKLGASQPALVLMDLRLPRAEDGLSLIAHLRQHSPWVPILVLSGWAPDLAGLAETGCVDRCLAKPVRSRELLRCVAQLSSVRG
jgi:two-component system response regulator GlrR